MSMMSVYLNSRWSQTPEYATNEATRRHAQAILDSVIDWRKLEQLGLGQRPTVPPELPRRPLLGLPTPPAPNRLAGPPHAPWPNGRPFPRLQPSTLAAQVGGQRFMHPPTHPLTRVHLMQLKGR